MYTLIGLMIAGAISGVIISYSLDLTRPKELVQGAVGGLIVGLVVALMLPRAV